MRPVVVMVSGLLIFLSSFGLGQQTLGVIAGINSYPLIESAEEGALLTTNSLVCADKSVLIAVLDVLEAGSDDEPLLSDDLSQEVNANCWLNQEAQLSFVAIDDVTKTHTQALETVGFEQVSTIKLIEVKVNALKLRAGH